MAKYNEIINYIDNVLKYDDLKKIKKRLKSQNRQIETDEDKIIVNTLDFFDDMAFQKTKLTTSRLFNNNSFFSPEKIIEADTKFANESLPTTGGYEEFILYFKQLHDQTLTLGINLSINISAGYKAGKYFQGHVIEICYSHIIKTWTLIDINQLPIKEKPASIEEVCTFISDALNRIGEQFDLFQTNLFSTPQHKNLLQQISKNVRDCISVTASPESSIGLNACQKELLQELGKEGLKPSHLRKWHSNQGYFTSDHSEALIHLVRKRFFSFEDAIELICDLDRRQALGVANGLKKQDVIGLDLFRINALQTFGRSGLTADHLRSWRGAFFSDAHYYALKYLLEKCQLQPEAAISELNGLSADQANSIVYCGERPDGTKIQIVPSITPKTSFFNNVLETNKCESEEDCESNKEKALSEPNL